MAYPMMLDHHGMIVSDPSTCRVIGCPRRALCELRVKARHFYVCHLHHEEIADYGDTWVFGFLPRDGIADPVIWQGIEPFGVTHHVWRQQFPRTRK